MISVTGRLVIGEEYRLRESVQQQLEMGRRHIILNLAGVTVVDSEGLGELVSAQTRTSNRGARLSLVSVSPRLQELLFITRLNTVFRVYENEAEALAGQ